MATLYAVLRRERHHKRLSIPYSISGPCNAMIKFGNEITAPRTGVISLVFSLEIKRCKGQPEYQGLGDTSLALHCT